MYTIFKSMGKLRALTDAGGTMVGKEARKSPGTGPGTGTAGTLSRPLANVENWLLHLGDPINQQRLLSLPPQVEAYFLEVSIWLADLMVMKVVGYRSHCRNRMAGKVEMVPWASVRRTMADSR